MRPGIRRRPLARRPGPTLPGALDRRRTRARASGLAPLQAKRHHHPTGRLCLRIRRPGPYPWIRRRAGQPAGGHRSAGRVPGCRRPVPARTGLPRWPGRSAAAGLRRPVQGRLARPEHRGRRPGRGEPRAARRRVEGHRLGSHHQPERAVGCLAGRAGQAWFRRRTRPEPHRTPAQRRIRADGPRRAAGGRPDRTSDSIQPRRGSAVRRHRRRRPRSTGTGAARRGVHRSVPGLGFPSRSRPQPARYVELAPAGQSPGTGRPRYPGDERRPPRHPGG
jgi:hypothetical protein